MLKLSEKQIETLILMHLEHIKGCRCYKNNNIGQYDVKKGKFKTTTSRYSPRGVSDIFGSYKSRAVYIEVKTPEEYAYLMKHYDEIRTYYGVCKKKNHLKNQIYFIETNRAEGCLAFFACSVEQVKKELGVE